MFLADSEFFFENPKHQNIKIMKSKNNKLASTAFLHSSTPIKLNLSEFGGAGTQVPLISDAKQITYLSYIAATLF